MKNADLIELLQSLNRTEIRYVKRYATQYQSDGQAKYMQLFELFLADKPHTVDELCLQLKLTTNGLANLCNYLYNLILKALNSYYAKKTPIRELRNLQSEIDILMEKRLQKQALKRLRKAKRLARKHRLLIPEFELTLKEKLYDVEYHNVKISKKMQQHQAACYDLLHKIEIELKMQELKDLVFSRQRFRQDYVSFFNSLPEQLSQLKDNIALEQFSPKFQIHWHSIWETYWDICKNPPKRYEHILATRQIFNRLPQLISQHGERYLNLLNNHLGICYQLGKTDEIATILQEMHTFSTQDNALKVQAFNYVSYGELIYLLSQEDYETVAVQLAPSIAQGLQEFDENITVFRKMIFSYNIAVACLLTHRHDESLHWLGYIFDLPQREIRRDVRTKAELLEIINHFELQHYQFIEYRIERLIRKTPKNSPERLTAKALRRLINLPQSDYRPVFQQLQQDLEPFQYIEEMTVWVGWYVSG